MTQCNSPAGVPSSQQTTPDLISLVAKAIADQAMRMVAAEQNTSPSADAKEVHRVNRGG